MGQNLFKSFLRKWRIVLSATLSVLVIFTAYVLARGFTSAPAVEASEESRLLMEIALRDADRDGLPDWEEALYGTDPKNADSNNLGMTDGEAVKNGLIVPKAVTDLPDSPGATGEGPIYDPSLPPPPAEGTLTSEFTKEFFRLYLEAKGERGGEALTSAELKTIADEAMASLAASVVRAPDFKSPQDLAIISGGGPAALMEFAARAEAVLTSNVGTARASELPYLDRAIRGIEAEDALVQLASIAKVSRDTAAGIAALEVPAELAKPVLALVNALMRTSEIVSDFARVNTDPLATMLALQQYPEVMLSLGGAFIEIGAIYRDAGLVLPDGTPGAGFVNLVTNVAAKQAAAAPTP